MNTYHIEIIETLVKTITVQASSDDEALQIARNDYQNEKIVLTADDCIVTEFLLVDK